MINPEKSGKNATRTASEKGWLHELTLLEGATRAPIIESVKVAAQKMRGQ